MTATATATTTCAHCTDCARSDVHHPPACTCDHLSSLGHTAPAGHSANTLRRYVLAYRESAAALRGMDRLAATGGYTGRNAGATERARARHADVMTAAVQVLVEAGERELAGHLGTEHVTASRLADARRAGQERPELQARLQGVRRTIRRALQSLSEQAVRDAFPAR